MKSPDGKRTEIISHLQYCLEILPRRDDGNNTSAIKRLYTRIYRVIDEMESTDVYNALNIFANEIDGGLREELLYFNIELVV